jgi:hypothetical protein
LDFFFKQLRLNKTNRFSNEFPFISFCGIERNYVKCDDLPYVITHLDEANDRVFLNQINSLNWSLNFNPEKLYYNPINGRLYYNFDGLENETVFAKKHAQINRENSYPKRLALVKSDINIYLMNHTENIENKTDHYSLDCSEFILKYKSKSYHLKNLP